MPHYKYINIQIYATLQIARKFIEIESLFTNKK